MDDTQNCKNEVVDPGPNNVAVPCPAPHKKRDVHAGP
jgi:hypothetical protein